MTGPLPGAPTGFPAAAGLPVVDRSADRAAAAAADRAELAASGAADPMAGIPAALLDGVGDFDRDSAGGCG